MTFTESHYVPILKGKQGELDALAKADNIQEFTALVEVTPIPQKYPPEGPPSPSKSIDKHIIDTAKDYKSAMGILPSVFIDGVHIEREQLQHGGSAIAGLFSRLRGSGIKFIPTIGLDRCEQYADAVRDAISKDKRGCCLRLVESDLESISDIDQQIRALFSVIGVSEKEVDLLIDFKGKVPPKVTLPLLVNALPRLNEWRNVILSSSCFPENLGNVKRNTVEELERLEWQAWVFLRNKQIAAGRRVPTYSDYGINHPELMDDELDPRMITVSPNIRYTSTVSYVIAKGQAQPRKKTAKTKEAKAARANLAPSSQYPQLASLIKNHQSWRTSSFSWGDGFIDRCSNHRCTGSNSTWRAVGASHHIAVVLKQISNLREL